MADWGGCRCGDCLLVREAGGLVLLARWACGVGFGPGMWGEFLDAFGLPAFCELPQQVAEVLAWVYSCVPARREYRVHHHCPVTACFGACKQEVLAAYCDPETPPLHCIVAYRYSAVF